MQCALISAHADRMLTGACNPMLCPIHVVSLAIAAGKDKNEIDLHMVEIMMMQVRTFVFFFVLATRVMACLRSITLHWLGLHWLCAGCYVAYPKRGQRKEEVHPLSVPSYGPRALAHPPTPLSCSPRLRRSFGRPRPTSTPSWSRASSWTTAPGTRTCRASSTTPTSSPLTSRWSVSISTRCSPETRTSNSLAPTWAPLPWSSNVHFPPPPTTLAHRLAHALVRPSVALAPCRRED